MQIFSAGNPILKQGVLPNKDVQVLTYRPTNVVDTSNQIWKYLRPQMLETFTMFPLDRARWGIASWLSFKVLFRFTWEQCNAYLDITKKITFEFEKLHEKKWIIFMNQNVSCFTCFLIISSDRSSIRYGVLLFISPTQTFWNFQHFCQYV